MSGTTPTTTTPAAETPDQALARAQAAAQAKRFGEAAGICNDVLGPRRTTHRRLPSLA